MGVPFSVTNMALEPMPQSKYSFISLFRKHNFSLSALHCPYEELVYYAHMSDESREKT